VEFRREVMRATKAREKLDHLEVKLHNARTSLESRKRYCKFCGDLFVVGKKSAIKYVHRPRLCSECLPFRGFKGTGKFSHIVRRIVEQEDIEAASKLLFLLKNRTVRTVKYKRGKESQAVTARWFIGQLLRQNFRCSICGDKQRSGRLLNVDHNHTTGALRGLLCVGCNFGLGTFKDSVKRLRSAVDYLT